MKRIVDLLIEDDKVTKNFSNHTFSAVPPAASMLFKKYNAKGLLAWAGVGSIQVCENSRTYLMSAPAIQQPGFPDRRTALVTEGFADNSCITLMTMISKLISTTRYLGTSWTGRYVVGKLLTDHIPTTQLMLVSIWFGNLIIRFPNQIPTSSICTDHILTVQLILPVRSQHLKLWTNWTGQYLVWKSYTDHILTVQLILPVRSQPLKLWTSWTGKYLVGKFLTDHILAIQWCYWPRTTPLKNLYDHLDNNESVPK